MSDTLVGGTQSAFRDATSGTTHKQSKAHSCWANAARHIISFARLTDSTIAPGVDLSSDEAFATSLQPSLTADQFHSAVAVLGDLGFNDGSDDKRIPTPDEIKQAIAKGFPILVLVGQESAQPSPQPDLAFTGGHWIVIHGLTSTNGLVVYDPAQGDSYEVPWNQTRFDSPDYAHTYFQNATEMEFLGLPAVPTPPPIPTPSSATTQASPTSTSTSTVSTKRSKGNATNTGKRRKKI